MKNIFQLLATLGSVAILFSITTSAFSKTVNDIDLDLIGSDKAKVVNVSIIQKDSAFKVRGKLRNKRTGRNVPIYGHVEISVIASDGSVVTTKKTLIRKINTAAVHRRNVNSRYASFQSVFKNVPAAGSTIRIKHIK